MLESVLTEVSGGQLSLKAKIQSSKTLPTSAAVEFIDMGVLGGTTPPSKLCKTPVTTDALTFELRASCTAPQPTSGNPALPRVYKAIYTDSTPNSRIEAKLLKNGTHIMLGVSPQRAERGDAVRLIATLPLSASGMVTFEREGLAIPECTAVPIVAGVTLKTASCLTRATTSFSYYTADYRANTDTMRATTTSGTPQTAPTTIGPERPKMAGAWSSINMGTWHSLRSTSTIAKVNHHGRR